MQLKKYQSKKREDVAGKITSYSALTGAFLAVAGSANSQIVYTDLIPDAVVNDTTFDVDIDGDGLADYFFNQFVQANGNLGAKLVANASHLGNMAIASKGTANYYYPSRLASGDPIGPAVAGFKSFQNAPGNEMSLVFAYVTGNVFGQWNNSSGYIGIKFKTGANDFYGWIECAVATNGDTITVKGFAYESTPNTLINAGDTASTINPGINENTNTLNQVGNFFPNPASKGKTKIIIESKESADLKIEVMNGMGQLLQTNSRRLISGKNMVPVNLIDLANGVYFVKLTSGNQLVYRKLNVNR